jgi:hypothetical protein
MSDLIDNDHPDAISVRRRQRRGVDHIYVNEGNGTRLGWVDLQTGVRVIEMPSRLETFEAAIEEWMNAHPDAKRPRAAVSVFGRPEGESRTSLTTSPA